MVLIYKVYYGGGKGLKPDISRRQGGESRKRKREVKVGRERGRRRHAFT